MSQQIFGYIDDNVGTNINLPPTAQFRAFRGNQPPGSGIYYAKLSDGTLEEIGGNGMGFVSGSGTLNFIAKFTPDGTTVGNSQLFDNGTSVGINTATPSASALLDVTSTTQGVLVPRMTTVQRNAIVAPGTGLFIYNTTTSKFNYWDGAAWQSIDTHMGTGDVEGSGTTGQLPVWTDGPNSVIGDSGITAASVSSVIANAFVQGGNSFGANAVLGTNDVFSLAFETSGTTRMTISATGFIGVNTAPVADQLITATSTGATSASYLFRGYNSTPTEIFSVRSDGYILAGVAIGSMTIGLNSGFTPAVANNTILGVGSFNSTATGTGNTGVGNSVLTAVTTGGSNIAMGSGALQSLTTATNCVALGAAAGATITTGGGNTFIGANCGSTTTGNGNTAVGNSAFDAANIASSCTAIGQGALGSCTTGNSNTAIGNNSGVFTTTGTDNVFVGASAGTNQTTQSNQLFIDNRDRGNAANDLSLSLVYGVFAATTPSQIFRMNANVGIGTSTFGDANANFVLAITNGATEVGAAITNGIQIYSVDSDDTTATLGLFLEQAVEAIGTFTASNKIKVKINGALYWIQLDAV